MNDFDEDEFFGEYFFAGYLHQIVADVGPETSIVLHQN